MSRRNAGLEVVLIDRDKEAADKGKAYSHKLMSDQIMKGRAKTADRDALLARITPTADYARLEGLRPRHRGGVRGPEGQGRGDREGRGGDPPGRDLRLQHLDPADLRPRARRRSGPSQFIGIHFFSPVEKMMLVEIIMGKETGDKALATALDFVRAIRKTPIVVNDARGFFANRCVLAYIREGHLMLAEGVPPAMIENAGKQAGMPVGPLSLNDEVGVDLASRSSRRRRRSSARRRSCPRRRSCSRRMVEQAGPPRPQEPQGLLRLSGEAARSGSGRA